MPNQPNSPHPRKPSWLKRSLPAGGNMGMVRNILGRFNVATVCDEARCPNRGVCHTAGTATFLILGERCTRDCRFCAVDHGTPPSPDPDEPRRVAGACLGLGLSHAVITSVTRDDLPDGGAAQFAATIGAVRDTVPGIVVEPLIPDFRGDADAIATVASALPHLVGHNIETVPRLYPEIRAGASYERSLGVLEMVGMRHGIPAKSGLMLGLGETDAEVRAVFSDLLDAGCTIMTLGQYLRPRASCVPVARFVPPGEFEDLRREAMSMGFDAVAAGPYVRSSYHAADVFEAACRNAVGGRCSGDSPGVADDAQKNQRA